MTPYEGLRNQMITVSETGLGGNTMITTNAHIDIHLDKTHHVSVRLKSKPPHVFFMSSTPSHLLQNLCHRRMTNPQQKHLTHQGIYLPR